jgi:hypothetical protein
MRASNDSASPPRSTNSPLLSDPPTTQPTSRAHTIDERNRPLHGTLARFIGERRESRICCESTFIGDCGFDRRKSPS